MYLIQRGKKPKPICRECQRVHADGVCPKAEPEFEGPVMPSTEFVRIVNGAKEELRFGTLPEGELKATWKGDLMVMAGQRCERLRTNSLVPFSDDEEVGLSMLKL
jgi:hypothetical protein